MTRLVVAMCLLGMPALASAVETSAPSAAATDESAADAKAAVIAAYRATGNLPRLAVMRAAVVDAALPDEVRDAALKVMDDTRAAIIAVVEAEAKAPSENDAQRKEAMAASQASFAADIRTALDTDANMRAVQIAMMRVEPDLRLLAKADVIDEMNDLALSEDQLGDITPAIQAAHAKLNALDAKDGVPVEEKRTDVLIAARAAVHKVFTAEQRDKWNQHVDAERRKNAPPPGGVIRGVRTNPPPPPQPPAK